MTTSKTDVDTSLDHIVIGTGAIGSGAAYWLARRTGGRVIALEQFELGHDRGASEDHSRIIRHSYQEPEHARLTHDAFSSWAEIEAASGLQLVARTGGIDLAGADAAGIASLERRAAAMADTNVPFRWLDAADLRRRYPQFAVDDDVRAIFQAETGILDVRKACAAHLALARTEGARIVSDTRVERVVETSAGVEVTVTGGDRFRAASASLCAGRWTARLARRMGWRLPLRYQHQQVTYHTPRHLSDYTIGKFPIWVWQGDRSFYGFPVYGLPAVKSAEDLGGRWVDLDDRHGPVDPEARARLEHFMAERLPGALGVELTTRVCAYELTPDRRFVLDGVPGCRRIFAAVGVGHAAKFGSLMGKVISDLVLDGGTNVDIEAFRADRPALTDADFAPTVPAWPKAAHE